MSRSPTLAILGAARWRKNLPLSLLLLGGALSVGAPVDLLSLMLALIGVLAGSALMTQINSLTDAELDRNSKPELILPLTADPARTRRVLLTELMIVVLATLSLVLRGQLLAACGLCSFVIIATLYSYNPFARDPVAGRLKTSPLGHAACLVTGYLGLWLTGLGCTGGLEPPVVLALLPVFVLVSSSEYAVFLAESAIDTRAERRMQLATLAARFGRQASSCVALLVALFSALALATFPSLLSPCSLPTGLVEILVLAATLRVLVVLALCRLRLESDDNRLRSTLPDLCFVCTRIMTVVLLACV